MTAKEQLIQDISRLPASSINIVREFVLFEISKAGNTDETAAVDGRSEAFKNLMKYKGSITRDIDCKKELMEALNEKYSIN